MRRGNYGKLTTLDKSGTSNHTGNKLAIGHQCTSHQMYYTKSGKTYHNQNDYDGGTNISPITQKYRNHKDIHHQTNVNNDDQLRNQLATLKLGALLAHNPQD